MCNVTDLHANAYLTCSTLLWKMVRTLQSFYTQTHLSWKKLALCKGDLYCNSHQRTLTRAITPFLSIVDTFTGVVVTEQTSLALAVVLSFRNTSIRACRPGAQCLPASSVAAAA
jgi:hypothetical protein